MSLNEPKWAWMSSIDPKSVQSDLIWAQNGPQNHVKWA